MKVVVILILTAIEYKMLVNHFLGTFFRFNNVISFNIASFVKEQHADENKLSNQYDESKNPSMQYKSLNVITLDLIQINNSNHADFILDLNYFSLFLAES